MTEIAKTEIPFQQVQAIATAFAKSGLFGMKTYDQALALIMIAQAEGLHPATAARDYDVISGRPAKKAEAIYRTFLESGGKVEWHEYTDIVVSATFSHPQGGKLKVTWDMERAARAGFGGKENWKKFPRQMLRARVISEGCKAVYPSATSGLYTPEEVADFDNDKNNEPKNVSEAPPPPADSDFGTPNEGAEIKITYPTEAQITRLYAIASSNKWSHEEVKTYLDTRWKIKSSKGMTLVQYEEFCDEIMPKMKFSDAFFAIPVDDMVAKEMPK